MLALAQVSSKDAGPGDKMHLVSLVAGSAQEECNFGVIASRIQHMDIGRSEGVHFGRVVDLCREIELVGQRDPRSNLVLHPR